MMRANRLKTSLWVNVQKRYCDSNNLPFYVLKKGEKSAGAVLIKVNYMNGSCRVYNQITNINGELGWQSLSEDNTPVPESRAEKYVCNQIKFDPDLWVIEIEDNRNKFRLDGFII